jgi:hypothetical protein
LAEGHIQKRCGKQAMRARDENPAVSMDFGQTIVSRHEYLGAIALGYDG